MDGRYCGRKQDTNSFAGFLRSSTNPKIPLTIFPFQFICSCFGIDQGGPTSLCRASRGYGIHSE